MKINTNNLNYLKINKSILKFSFYLSKYGFVSGSTKQKWLGAPHRQGIGFLREDIEGKHTSYLIGYNLRSCLIWESLIGFL